MSMKRVHSRVQRVRSRRNDGPRESTRTGAATTRILGAFVVLLSLLVVVGCGGGGGSDAPSISISALEYAPKSVSESTQAMAISGSVEVTTGVDLATIRLTDSRGGNFSIPISGAAGVRSGKIGVNASFTAHPAGTYAFTVWLVGVDGGESNRLSGSIEIEGARPVAHAGGHQNVVTGTVVTLDGSRSSDANGDPLTYAWTLSSVPAGGSATLAGATTVRPTFTADVPGTYVFTLVVSDGQLDSAPAAVVITAGAANVAPVADAGDARNVVTGTAVTLDGSRSTDANGDALTYAWTLNSRPAGSSATLAGAATVRPTFTADVAGSYVFTLTVSDGEMGSAPAIVVVTAAVANVAPVADAGDARNVVTGTAVTLDGSRSTDANGDALAYAWTLVSKPDGSAAALSGATTVSPTFTADLDGAYVAQLVVRDGTLNSVISTVVVTASALPAGVTVRALATHDIGAPGGGFSHWRYVLGTNGVLYIRYALGQRLHDGSRNVIETYAVDIHGDYTGMAFDERWVVAMVSPRMLHIVSGKDERAMRTEVPFTDSPVVDYAVRMNRDYTADTYFVLENGTLWKYASNRYQREQVAFPYPLRALAIERSRSRSFWERRRNGDPSDDARAAALRFYGIALDGTARVSHVDDPQSFVTLDVPGRVVKLTDHSQWGVFALTESGDVYWLNADAATVPDTNGLPRYEQQLQDDGTVGEFPTFVHPQNAVVKLPNLPVICDTGSTYAIECGTGQVYDWVMAGWTAESGLRTSGGTSFGLRTAPKVADRFNGGIRAVAAVNEWTESVGGQGQASSGVVFFYSAGGETVGLDNGPLPLEALINIYP